MSNDNKIIQQNNNGLPIGLVYLNVPDITILQTRLQNQHRPHIKIWKSRFPNTQEELGHEIEKQKQLFMLQHQDENN